MMLPRHYSTRPLKYVDPSGLEYIILWSYGSRELNAYEDSDGKVDWVKFEKEDSFSKAARTRMQELISRGVDPEYIILERMDSVKDLELVWEKISKLDNVEVLNIFSHGWEGGPEVAGGSKKFWNKASTLNWANDAYAIFHGCNTANFAERFAKSQNVLSYGQKGYASFSTNKKIHIPIRKNSSKVYLYHFEFLNLVNWNGLGIQYQP